MNEPLKKRVIPPTFDNRGNPSWKSRMSPPDESVAVVKMIASRIIPVIFIPGVMGSNLTESNPADPSKIVRWNLDSDGLDHAGAWALASRDAKFRKSYLQPSKMKVDNSGLVPSDLPIPAEELRRRGWGEIGALSYKDSLVWLENALNDHDVAPNGKRKELTRLNLKALLGEAALTEEEWDLSYKYRFPVHAFGYNWLDDNAESAKALGRRIDEVIARYKAEKKRCEKVILITHSMGGLVARHCSEVRSYRDKILGIVHGVMPAIGAAAVYRRMKAGTENFAKGFGASLSGAGAASALGNDAAEMTAVLSSSPGPLQLLPTPEYGNGWLKIRDGAQEVALPQAGDPYAEIYLQRGKWWGLCEEHLMNPWNEETDPKARQVQIDKDWKIFADIVGAQVKTFHTKIAGKYHPNTYAFYGSGPDKNSVGNVQWLRMGTGRAPTDALKARAINPNQINEARTTRAPVLTGQGELTRDYMLQGPDETGDGTVPMRSGVQPKSHCKAMLQVQVGHEPAYNPTKGAENVRACMFTLRCIVKIAQAVQQTSLKYD